MAYFSSSSMGMGRGGGGRGGGDRMGGLGSDLQAVDWSKVNAPPVVWPKHSLPSKTKDRHPDDIEEWRKKVTITIASGKEDCPPPILSFNECRDIVPDYITDSFLRQKFTEPTPIQSQAWSVGLINRDIVGIAKTGSGKTLAFLIPGIVHILAQPKQARGDGPFMLVLAPTRELAKQIDDECIKVTEGTAIKTVCAYGGTVKYDQKRKFQDGVQIAICCPGRLIDLLSERATNLHRVSYLVMDEADRMLDMGFEPQIRMICQQCRPERQTMMFSATWPREVQSLAESYQKRYIRMHVGSMELTANADVKQIVFVVQDFQKMDRLMEIIAKGPYKKVLVFTATKRDCEHMCDRLRRERVFALSIHGDKTQQQRDQSLEQFRQARAGCLIATDVAQRGLDIKDLDAVVNFDFPNGMEDYVHRVGRTGRAGATGDAISFINEKHSRLVPELIAMMRKGNHAVSEELEMLGRSGGGGRSFTRYGPAPPSMMRPPMFAQQQQQAYAYPPPPQRYEERAAMPPQKRERSPAALRRASPPPRDRSPPRRRSPPPRDRRDDRSPPRRDRSPPRKERRERSPSRRRRDPSRRRASPSHSPPRYGRNEERSPPRRRSDSPVRRRRRSSS